MWTDIKDISIFISETSTEITEKQVILIDVNGNNKNKPHVVRTFKSAKNKEWFWKV